MIREVAFYAWWGGLVWTAAGFITLSTLDMLGGRRFVRSAIPETDGGRLFAARLVALWVAWPVVAAKEVVWAVGRHGWSAAVASVRFLALVVREAGRIIGSTGR